MISENEVPDMNWTLEQLGEFCIQRHQRLALDAWMVGKAMCLAKEHCEETDASFTEWKRKHGFSDSMASRYMRLVLAFPGEEDRQRLASLGIMAALIEAGAVKPKSVDVLDTDEQTRSDVAEPPALDLACPKQLQLASNTAPVASPPDDSPVDSHVPAPSDGSPPTWAVSDDDDDDYMEVTADDPLAREWSRSETLEEECRKVVPCQVRFLKDKVQMLLDQSAEQLRHAWPESEADRKAISEDIEAVLRLLPALAATLDAGRRELAIAG